MKTKRLKYNDIEETLQLIKIQIADSQVFAKNWLDYYKIKTPLDLWEVLKEQIIFIHDPENTELLQSMKTLLTYKNYHKQPGAGDCDCFVITVTTCALVMKWPVKIILAGREPSRPVHIWNIIKNYDFDLTQPDFDTCRLYPYIQTIDVYPNILNINPVLELKKILKERYNYIF